MEPGEIALHLCAQLARQVMWLGFVLMHLVLAVVLLAAAWVTHTTAQTAWSWLTAAIESHPWMWLAAFGVSLATIGKLYVRLWRRGYARLVGRPMIRPILDEIREKS